MIYLTLIPFVIAALALLIEIAENDKLILELKAFNEENQRVRYVRMEFRNALCLKSSQCQ